MDALQKKRDEVYKNSNEFTKAMYEDGELGGILSKLIAEFELSGEKVSQFIHVYGDVILDISPKEEIDTKLGEEIGLSAQQIARTHEGLRSFMSRLSGQPSIPLVTPDTKERLDLRPQGAVPPVPEPPKAPPAPPQGARPLTREELMNALSPKRTMTADIQAMQQKQEPEKPKESFPGYEAFRKLNAEKE